MATNAPAQSSVEQLCDEMERFTRMLRSNEDSRALDSICNIELERLREEVRRHHANANQILASTMHEVVERTSLSSSLSSPLSSPDKWLFISKRGLKATGDAAAMLEYVWRLERDGAVPRPKTAARRRYTLSDSFDTVVSVCYRSQTEHPIVEWKDAVVNRYERIKLKLCAPDGTRAELEATGNMTVRRLAAAWGKATGTTAADFFLPPSEEPIAWRKPDAVCSDSDESAEQCLEATDLSDGCEVFVVPTSDSLQSVAVSKGLNHCPTCLGNFIRRSVCMNCCDNHNDHCFAGESLATLESGKRCRVDALSVGDVVRSAAPNGGLSTICEVVVSRPSSERSMTTLNGVRLTSDHPVFDRGASSWCYPVDVEGAVSEDRSSDPVYNFVMQGGEKAPPLTHTVLLGPQDLLCATLGCGPAALCGSAAGRAADAIHGRGFWRQYGS